MKRTILATLLVTLVCSLTVFAQDNNGGSDLEKQLQKLSGSAGQSYVGPVSNGFGTNLNGGLFHGAPAAKIFGIDIEIGLVAMGTPFKDEAKTFTTEGTFRFDQAQAAQIVNQNPSIPAAARNAVINQIVSQDYKAKIQGPTALGKTFNSDHPSIDNQIYVTFLANDVIVNGTSYHLNQAAPEGLGIGGIDGLNNLSFLPLGAPQVTLGTVYGTQVAIRYLPAMKLPGDAGSAIGKVKYSGFGMQHNPGVWLKTPLPVDFAVSFFSQKLTIDPYLEAKGSSYGLTVSKCFSAAGLVSATPYVGFAIEKSSMNFKYQASDSLKVNGITLPPPQVEFSLDGANTSRFTVGASFKLLFININADYNFGKYKSFTGGVMFII
jgi:hypothetical protein